MLRFNNFDFFIRFWKISHLFVRRDVCTHVCTHVLKSVAFALLVPADAILLTYLFYLYFIRYTVFGYIIHEVCSII